MQAPPLPPTPLMPSSPAAQDPRQALLAQLHDLHEPPVIGLLPLAPGWYVAIALVLLAVGGALYAGWRYHRQRRYRRQALAELKSIEREAHTGANATQVHAIMRLLKRSYFSAYADSRHQVAGDYGDRWWQRLEHSCQPPLRETSLNAFVNAALYAPNTPVTAAQMQSLIDFSRQWLRRHRRQRPNPGAQRTTERGDARRSDARRSDVRKIAHV